MMLAKNADIENQPGLYVLVLKLGPQKQSICIGARGKLTFQPGYYGYVGSALSGLGKRLKRHSNTQSKKHWHIDYLKPRCKIDSAVVWLLVGGECKLNRKAQKEAKTSIRGFGCSDCHCSSHLHYWTTNPRSRLLTLEFRGIEARIWKSSNY
ncbi:MAG: GIY-YIG nuclease family protein [Planctomycetes bacterium]|nr:GIY-YIG nuclease family protein [Planctomycetota bacterium]